jgi:hypothetical protein
LGQRYGFAAWLSPSCLEFSLNCPIYAVALHTKQDAAGSKGTACQAHLMLHGG